MRKYILDINKNPPIKTYNHHAFGTGIITSVDKGMEWMLNNYLQLSFYPDYGPYTFDFYMDYIYCQPIFDREHLSDDILDIVRWDPIKVFVSAIKQEKYVICCVNEYHIPSRDAYMRYHFKHNLLIYGVDTDNKKFYTAGYDDTGKYGFQEISYKHLKKASPSDVNILTFRKQYDFNIAVEHIDSQIKQYNNESPLEPTGSYPKEGRTVGVRAVDKMLDYMDEMVKNECQININPVNILWEHRCLMLKRLKKLADMNVISNNVANKFKEQVYNCEKMRNRVMLYNMRQEKKDSAALKELIGMQRSVCMPRVL